MYLLSKSNAHPHAVSASHLHTRAPPIFIGLLLLLLGSLVYLLDRNPDSVYFIPSWLSQWSPYQSFYGKFGNFIPTFVHPFALILLTAAFVELKKHNIIGICLTWLLIDSLFELAQMTVVAQWLIGIVPSFTNVPILENTRNYFLYGTFDVLDLVSIVLGTMAAYYTLIYFKRRYNL